MKICYKTTNKRTNAFSAMVLVILLISLLRCGRIFAEELLIYPSAGTFSDEQVSFPGEIPDLLTGLINNPNDIGMVMYSKPSFSGEIVRTVMNNTPVSVISEQTEAEGYRWVRVMTNEGSEGWVFATGIVGLDGKQMLPGMTYEKQTFESIPAEPGSEVNYYSGKNAPKNTVKTDNDAQNGVRVWVYETGRRYHSHSGCSGSDDWQVSLEEAQRMGRTPCKKCY